MGEVSYICISYVTHNITCVSNLNLHTCSSYHFLYSNMSVEQSIIGIQCLHCCCNSRIYSTHGINHSCHNSITSAQKKWVKIKGTSALCIDTASGVHDCIFLKVRLAQLPASDGVRFFDVLKAARHLHFWCLFRRFLSWRKMASLRRK